MVLKKQSGIGCRPSWPSRLSGLIVCYATTVLIAGCATGEVGKAPARLDALQGRYAQDANRIKADPVEFLRTLRTRCDGLEQYRLMFYRQERLGLFMPQLGAMEEIQAAFRREPFSVKFDWDDPERDYFESVYVAGQNGDKLIVRERKGIFPFPPMVRMVNVKDPVIWGKAKNPITDFGLARLTQRILALFDDAELAQVLMISYEGIVNLDPMERPSHHLHIEQPPMAGYTHTRRDFYVDAETLLPAGTDLWLANRILDARYRYSSIDTNVTLSDTNFRLRQDHPKTASTE